MYDVEAAQQVFHTKGYIFKKEEIYRIILGSSNMTSAALTVNKEWNTKLISTENGEVAQEIVQEFKSLWDLSLIHIQMCIRDRDYRGTKVTLAYSGMPFSVSENIYIIGMMNTADRSLAMIDYALRRRFCFFAMEPGFNFEDFRNYQNSFANETFNALIDQIKALNKEITEDSSLGRGFQMCIRDRSSSTGQSKMNTLAFVKAILDYANDPGREGVFEVTKNYPLLIDAPFGDIFDKNLEKSAETLHLFTHQIILMLAKESYSSVQGYISPYVSTCLLYTSRGV